MNEEWAKAFVAAQGDLPEITKDKTVTVKTKSGQSFKYSYADLPTIVAKVRPVLAKHGLAVAQDVEIQDGRVVVTTRIYHVSGHIEKFGPVVLHGGNDAQAAGSAITYARRYALCAALNIAADEDDDGQINKNSAGSAPSSASRPKHAEPQSAPAADSPPTYSGEVTDAGSHPPIQADAVPVASPDQTQEPGDTSSEDSRVWGSARGSEDSVTPAPDTQKSGGALQQGPTAVPPATESWEVIHGAVGRGVVKEVKVRIAAARLCSEREGCPIPQKYEDIKNCPPDVLAELAEEVRQKEGVSA